MKVRAQVKSVGRKNQLPEQIVARLSLEPGVTSIRWEITSAVDVGEDQIVEAPPGFEESQA